jgi:hypothetical protein
MKLADLLIIYFACGAPFAVQRFLSGSSDTVFRQIASVFATLVLWPIFAFGSIWAWISTGRKSVSPISAQWTEKELGRLQGEFEAIIAERCGSVSIFEFREVFARYSGLAAAVADKYEGPAVADVFEIAGSTSPQIASLCLDRRNRSRTLLHAERARHEFLDTVAAIAADGFGDERVYHLAAETAACVNDAFAQDELSSLLTISSNDLPTADQVGEIWNNVPQTR